jgi:hypothetical protein
VRTSGSRQSWLPHEALVVLLFHLRITRILVDQANSVRSVNSGCLWYFTSFDTGEAHSWPHYSRSNRVDVFIRMYWEVALRELTYDNAPRPRVRTY